MARMRFVFCSLLVLLVVVFHTPTTAIGASVGINYGRIANNLPTPQNVVPILKSINVNRVKLYDADPRVLRAFANTGVEFVVAIGNEFLSKVIDPEAAQTWIKTNVQPYLPATKITSITVGNEVLTFNDTSLSGCLFPAMQSVHNALATLGLDKQVTVTTAHSLGVLETSYPPSSGAFRKDLKGCITQILDFHTKTGSSILINAYPFFAYKGSPKQVSLDYVLFQSKSNQGILDSATNLHYDNMLFAQIDAVYTAMAALGFKKVPVQISETGWPSKGDEDEVGASPENAQKYNGNLMKLVMQKKGTPLKPNNQLDVYVFALFNENMKPGPTSERNYGLFKPDGTPAYQLEGLISDGSKTNSSSGGGNGNGDGDGDEDGDGGSSSKSNTTSVTPSPDMPGYLNISSAKGEMLYGGPRVYLKVLVIACLNSMLVCL